MKRERAAARWQRILPAALRVAGIYATGVLLMLVPFMLMPRGGLPSFRLVTTLGAAVSVLFALAFLLLAVARRAGVVMLWALLGILWGLLLAAHDEPVELAIGFVGWSVLALPLHGLCVMGMPEGVAVRLGRTRVRASSVATTLWIATLIPAWTVLYFSLRIMFPEPHTAFFLAGKIAPFLWGPAPLALMVLSVAHVWTATEP